MTASQPQRRIVMTASGSGQGPNRANVWRRAGVRSPIGHETAIRPVDLTRQPSAGDHHRRDRQALVGDPRTRIRPSLAPREVEVLIAWFQTESKEEVARRLSISQTTVRTHLQ